MNEKLMEILLYYKNTYGIEEEVVDIYNDLILNNAQIEGDSFYCPVWNGEHNGWILLAGTKEKADMWVLKKIIKLIKSGDKIYTMFNGNSEYLLSVFSRYDLKILSRKNEISYIQFN